MVNMFGRNIKSQIITSLLFCSGPDIADYAEQHSHILVPDEGADYDQLVEIDLSTVLHYYHTISPGFFPSFSYLSLSHSCFSLPSIYLFIFPPSLLSFCLPLSSFILLFIPLFFYSGLPLISFFSSLLLLPLSPLSFLLLLA